MLLIKEQCSVKAPTLNYKKKQALMKKAAECVHMLINLCQQASQERAYSTLLQQVFLNKTWLPNRTWIPEERGPGFLNHPARHANWTLQNHCMPNHIWMPPEAFFWASVHILDISWGPSSLRPLMSLLTTLLWVVRMHACSFFYKILFHKLAS